MKGAFAMWKNSRMIILVAVCAAIYGAVLIAFKTAIPLIPGITELRVGRISPVGYTYYTSAKGCFMDCSLRVEKT